jgi:ADP-ribose pyrophosphatase YjhB (NUDIX family)
MGHDDEYAERRSVSWVRTGTGQVGQQYDPRVPIPDFIVDLRSKIGTQLLWLPGVTAVIIRGGEVLLVQRSDSGRWAPITGVVDPGEHPADAAVREAKEETGVEIVIERLSWVHVTPVIRYPNGDQAQYLDHTFLCRYVAGEPHAADDESLDAKWFDLDNLPDMPGNCVERITTATSDSPHTRL